MDISAYQHMNIRMSTRGKRPLRNLTPSDKVRAIQRIHNGETKASVSRDIGVPESTLRGWCKNEQKLRFMCRQLGTDQLSMSVVENPPEKRAKFDNHISAPPKFSNVPTYEDFAYNRLPLNGIDFATNNNNNNNNHSIMEKIAFNEIMKKNSLLAETGDTKHFGSSGHLPGISASSVSVDYTQQLSMIQNLNLLSLLNPSLAALSGVSAGSSLDSAKPKLPLHASNSMADEMKDNAKNTATALTVKNWAKDPSSSVSSTNNKNKHNHNDTNNNDVKQNHHPMAALAFPEALNLPSFFPAGLPQMPNPSPDSESSNAALLEWCKVFNASLNFLALAAAAAALQPQTLPLSSEQDQDRATDNILYAQLTKSPGTYNSPTNTYMHSDFSNDSYFDSEPEDLSVRSPTSKISSPANSRSQSPTKSTASSSLMHSDME